MIASHGSENGRHDACMALAAERTHWLGRMVKSALLACRGKGKGEPAACGPAPKAALGDPARPMDEWGWLESRRKTVGTELNHPPEPTPSHCL